MIEKYEFRATVEYLAESFAIATMLASLASNIPPHEEAAFAALYTICACTVDKETGEYVDAHEFGLQLLQGSKIVLAIYVEAFRVFCEGLFTEYEANNDPRLEPFRDFMKGLSDDS